MALLLYLRWNMVLILEQYLCYAPNTSDASLLDSTHPHRATDCNHRAYEYERAFLCAPNKHTNAPDPAAVASNKCLFIQMQRKKKYTDENIYKYIWKNGISYAFSCKFVCSRFAFYTRYVEQFLLKFDYKLDSYDKRQHTAQMVGKFGLRRQVSVYGF